MNKESISVTVHACTCMGNELLPDDNVICKNCEMLLIAKAYRITSGANTEAKGRSPNQKKTSGRTRKGGHLAHW